jgi:Ca2+/Na+ antiporter
VAILAIGLFALMTLRFYVFYIMVFAVVCALIMGRQKLSAQAFLRQFVIMFVVGAVLAGLGVSRFASKQIDQYGSFRQLQVMRLDASRSAASGFGEDIDVSTPEGALAAIPIGLMYLFLAPFPWQYSSLRSMITLPEMTIWWGSLPFLVLGLWFTIRHKLREVAPIVIFLTVLTISYSIVQGNVGTVYRQRAQLLIFYFLFVAVGFALFKEKRDQRAQRAKAEKEANRIPPELRAKKTAREGRLPVPG